MTLMPVLFQGYHIRKHCSWRTSRLELVFLRKGDHGEIGSLIEIFFLIDKASNKIVF